MSYYDRCLMTIPGRDIRPAQPTRRNLAHLPFYDRLVAMADEYDRLIVAGLPVAARTVKEEAQSLVDAWFEGRDARLDLEAEEQEQLAAARESIGLTAAEIDPMAGF